MARALRIEMPGMWYHVFNRGNDRATVFLDDTDYQMFLNKLADSCAQYHVDVHAYALMRNHFHLFVKTREANLGRFMQRLLTAFSIARNLKHDRVGHVFQGRYKAIVVDRDAYGAEVSRYIHLNPARTMGDEKDLERRRAELRGYKWSSYRAMIGLVAPHAALEREETLVRFGRSRHEQEHEYAVFVEEGLLRTVDDPAALARAQLVLGKDRFVERILRILAKRKEKDIQAERSRRRLVSPSVRAVVQQVATAFGTTAHSLMRRRGYSNTARQTALWAASKACTGATSLKAIGKMFGIGVCGVVQARERLERAMRVSKTLRRRLTDLLNMCNVNA